MLRRHLITSMAALAAAALAGPAAAQDTVKIGLILPMTGQQASTGKQIDAAVKLYQAQHGTTVAGKKIEVIVKDDAAVPDNTKRIAQELIVNDKVQFHRRLRRDAGGARRRAARHRSQGPADRDGGRHLDHHRALALHRAHQLHAGAVLGDHRRLGGRRTASRRSSPWCRTTRPAPTPRSRSRIAFQGRRRRDRRGDPLPARQSGLRAVPAARRRRQARRASSSSCRPARAAPSCKQFVERGLDKAGIKLIGPGDVTDDDLLQRHGRRRDRHRHRALLFGRAPFGDEQGLCRGLQEGQQLPAELHVGRRL